MYTKHYALVYRSNVCYSGEWLLSSHGLFGPYCGILPKWSILTLRNVATIFYEGYKGHTAQIAFLYQAVTYKVLHYNDKPHLLQYQHQYKQRTTLVAPDYKPQRIYTDSHQFIWHIKTHPYEKFQVALQISEKRNILNVDICEGPSIVVPQLCLSKKNTASSVSQNWTLITKAFQMAIS